MYLIEYFERQKQRCERELKYADAPGFQLFERTPQGEQDISEQQLRKARASGWSLRRHKAIW